MAFSLLSRVVVILDIFEPPRKTVRLVAGDSDLGDGATVAEMLLQLIGRRAVNITDKV